MTLQILCLRGPTARERKLFEVLVFFIVNVTMDAVSRAGLLLSFWFEPASGLAKRGLMF